MDDDSWNMIKTSELRKIENTAHEIRDMCMSSSVCGKAVEILICCNTVGPPVTKSKTAVCMEKIDFDKLFALKKELTGIMSRMACREVLK